MSRDDAKEFIDHLNIHPNMKVDLQNLFDNLNNESTLHDEQVAIFSKKYHMDYDEVYDIVADLYNLY